MWFVATVRVELTLPPWAGVTELGLNVQLLRDGQPVTLRPTVPPNPFKDVTVAVYVVLEPCVTVWLEGVAETEKSEFAEVTTSVTDVVWIRVPPVPWIVMV